jgi:hypothetical protein
VEPGLYLTFFTQGEHFGDELPPVGPLEHVVVRDRALIADRRDGHHADFFGGGGRGIEAEYEFQRAMGKEPGGVRRPDLRIVAPEGVYLRFVSFGSAAEHDPVPELGPYAVVVVSTRAVEADGDRVAARMGTTQNLWELTAVGGTALGGIIRPDIAFRTRSTRYHPEIKRFKPAPQPAVAPVHAAAAPTSQAHPPSKPPRPATPTATPARPPIGPEARAPAAPAQSSRPTEAATLTLRDRIKPEPVRSQYAAAAATGNPREWAGAVWRLRFVILAVLVLLIAVFSVPSIRSVLAGGTPAGSTVAVGTTLTSPNWSYTVGSVRRIAKIGGAQARGTYLVVQVTTTRSMAGAQLLPSNFAVATANGQEYPALSISSGVYAGPENPISSYAWPKEFPVGKGVVVPLIFEVDPSVSGTQLVILDVPSTRVRLE